jgi:hypothetical protein
MALTMADNQYADCVITGAVDAKGAAVAVPAGSVETWTSDTPGVATVAQSTDGLTGRVTAVSAGSATVTADGKFTDAAGAVHDLLFTLGVTIVAGPAVGLTATVGVPQTQPAPAPLP